MTVELDDSLVAAVDRIATVRPLLVALDFDGVLAPIVDDPASSRPLSGSVAAVERLLDRPEVTVAYVSGRDLDGLAAAATPPDAVHLVGSHGAQWQDRLRPADAAEGLTEGQQERLRTVTRQLEDIAARYPGTRVEHKPTAAVLHTRLAADPQTRRRATEAALAGPATSPEVKVTPGKDVVEIAVTRTDKGLAVQWLREHFGARAVCYVGDDVTDEAVFTTLHGSDLGIKVGPGDTAAAHRVGTPEDVTVLLTRLADRLA